MPESGFLKSAVLPSAGLLVFEGPVCVSDELLVASLPGEEVIPGPCYSNLAVSFCSKSLLCKNPKALCL